MDDRQNAWQNNVRYSQGEAGNEQRQHLRGRHSQLRVGHSRDTVEGNRSRKRAKERDTI